MSPFTVLRTEWPEVPEAARRAELAAARKSAPPDAVARKACVYSPLCWG